MSRRGLLLFLGLGLVWGIPYALIKVAITELSPEMLVLARTAIAALVLLPLAVARRQLRPALAHKLPLAIYTLVEIVLPWYFINSAEQRLPSSTAGLLLATIPLVGVGIAFLFGRAEKLSLGNWAGLAAGLAGVALLVGFDVAGSSLIGVAELAVAVVGYALGPAILARSLPGVPALGIASLSLAGTAVVYVPVVALSGRVPTQWPSARIVVAVLILALVCSALAFLLMPALITEVGPVRMTAVTYLNPAVAIAVGALLLRERITIVTVAGFALVLAGSYLVNRRRRGPIAEQPPVAANPLTD